MQPEWLWCECEALCDWDMLYNKTTNVALWRDINTIAFILRIPVSTARRHLHIMEQWGRIERRRAWSSTGWYPGYQYRLTKYWYGVHSIPF